MDQKHEHLSGRLDIIVKISLDRDNGGSLRGKMVTIISHCPDSARNLKGVKDQGFGIIMLPLKVRTIKFNILHFSTL